MEVVSKPETVAFFDEEYNNCSVRYGDLKKQLAEDVIAFTTPFRDKILNLSDDTEYLRKVTRQGAEVARESASKTVREVREIIGFKPF
jgi:tryptophanyl-tRNA synthetase